MITLRLRKRSLAYRMALLCGLAASLTSAQGAAGIIFQDDFESCDRTKTQNGFEWSVGTRTSVNSVNPQGGNCALEFAYQAAVDGKDSFSEQRFFLGGNYPDIWIKYDLYIPANYYHRTQTIGATNNKGFVMMWEGDYGSPGMMLNPNFWADGSGQSTTTLFLWVPGNNDPLNKASRHYSSAYFLDPYSIRSSDRGKWMEVITHYRYASAANNDGMVQIWLTPQGGSQRQILSIVQGNWYSANTLGFDKGYLLGWANSGFAEETKFYIDNVVFSTAPIETTVPASDPPNGVRSPAVK